MAFEFKLTVFYLCPLLVSGRRIYVSAPKQQSHLYCLLFRGLADLPDVDCQLSKRSDMSFVNKLNIRKFSLIKDDSHDCLSCSNRAVYFGVHFFNTYWISFPDKSIKNVLAKLFSLYYHFFALWMHLFIKHCQSIYTICLFCYSWCYWPWVQTVKACTSDYWYLGTTRNQHLNFVVFKFFKDFVFQEWRFRKPSDHEDEVYLLLFWIDLTKKLFNFSFDILEERLKERSHERTWQLDIWCSSDFDLQLRHILVTNIMSLN